MQKIKTPLLISLIFVSLSACQKHEPERVEVTRYFDVFGKTFEIKPLASATSQEQKLSKATGMVEIINSGTGSGFFISDDGLFMTNQHVIEKLNCRPQICPGVRIIRQASADGDMEFFDQVAPFYSPKIRILPSSRST